MIKSKKLKNSIFLVLGLIIIILLSSCTPTYNVSVLVSPANSGTVIPSGGTFTSGVAITLTAQPAKGFRFDYWSGNASGISNPLNLTVDSVKNITANFKAQFTVNVTTSPDSGGSVSPSQRVFDEGAQVQLTAQPVPGYRFDYWSGDAKGSDNPLSFIADKGENITAHFKVQFVLIVKTSPINGGTVTPAGGTYDDGANVQLVAQPALGYRFGYWSGGATGTTNNITVVMSGNKIITANFVAQYKLTTSVNPAGAGTVTPANGTFDKGISLPLTAAPLAGYVFDHWSGDASGNSSSINITMNSDKKITANFNKMILSNDGQIGFTLDSFERTKTWPSDMGPGSSARAGYSYCVIKVKIELIKEGHICFTTATKSILFSMDGVTYQEKGWSWKGFYWNDPHELDSWELVVGSTGEIVFELPENIQADKMDLAYEYFKSWSSSWKPVSPETKYVTIDLN